MEEQEKQKRKAALAAYLPEGELATEGHAQAMRANAREVEAKQHGEMGQGVVEEGGVEEPCVESDLLELWGAMGEAHFAAEQRRMKSPDLAAQVEREFCAPEAQDYQILADCCLSGPWEV